MSVIAELREARKSGRPVRKTLPISKKVGGCKKHSRSFTQSNPGTLGDEIRAVLPWFSTSETDCTDRQQYLNRRGLAWTRKSFKHIVSWVTKEARTLGVQISENSLKMAVMVAILKEQQNERNRTTAEVAP